MCRWVMVLFRLGWFMKKFFVWLIRIMFLLDVLIVLCVVCICVIVLFSVCSGCVGFGLVFLMEMLVMLVVMVCVMLWFIVLRLLKLLLKFVFIGSGVVVVSVCRWFNVVFSDSLLLVLFWFYVIFELVLVSVGKLRLCR